MNEIRYDGASMLLIVIATLTFLRRNNLIISYINLGDAR